MNIYLIQMKNKYHAIKDNNTLNRFVVVAMCERKLVLDKHNAVIF